MFAFLQSSGTSLLFQVSVLVTVQTLHQLVPSVLQKGFHWILSAWISLTFLWLSLPPLSYTHLLIKKNFAEFLITIKVFFYFNRNRETIYMLVFLISSVMSWCLICNSLFGSELFEEINISDDFRMPHFSINIYVPTGLFMHPME